MIKKRKSKPKAKNVLLLKRFLSKIGNTCEVENKKNEFTRFEDILFQC